jgi:NADPH-dependent 2,4-dienoyl-CoA reductase/sulfur reductase-like enzyme
VVLGADRPPVERYECYLRRLKAPQVASAGQTVTAGKAWEVVVVERLVVIGGDAAGMSAASQARRRRGVDELAIEAFERGDFTSYSACGIPYFVGGLVSDVDRLIARSPDVFQRSFAIDVGLRHEVTEIDLDRRLVIVRDMDAGIDRRVEFDQLVVATGGLPVRPALPGADASGVFGVQVLDDGLAMRRVVDDSSPQRAVVVGGGYIGLEMAEALRMRGLEVALVERGPQPMATLDPDMGALVAEALREAGIAVHVGEVVNGFETCGGAVRAVVTDQRVLPADFVVLGLGVRPNVAVAEAAGIPIGPSGAVRVDRRMRTPIDGVWAAGDCAEKFHRVSQRSVAFALGTHANKEGRVAGINIGGGYATFPGVVGTAVSKICAVEVARTGLGEAEAVRAGFQVLSTVVDSTTRAGYYPGAAPIKTKLIVEKRSGRLLGAQIVGREGAAKRIDVLAAALWSEMTVDELLNVDLSYAPPYAPVWDPVLIAARKAWEHVEDTLTECL